MIQKCDCHLSGRAKKTRRKKTKQKTLQAQIANLHKWVELKTLAGSLHTRKEVGEEKKINLFKDRQEVSYRAYQRGGLLPAGQ